MAVPPSETNEKFSVTDCDWFKTVVLESLYQYLLGIYVFRFRYSIWRLDRPKVARFQTDCRHSCRAGTWVKAGETVERNYQPGP